MIPHPGDSTAAVDILLPFSRSGGGGSVVGGALLAKALRDLGYGVHALFPAADDGQQILQMYGIPTSIIDAPPIHSVRGGAKGWRSMVPALVANAATVRYAFRYLRARRPRAVHVNDDSTLLAWGVAARTLGIPVVWHLRKSRRGLLDPIRLRVVRECISMSESTSRRIPGPPSTELIFDPLDTDKFFPRDDPPALRRDLGLAPKLTLLFVGRPTAYKRADWAVAALAKLLESGIEAQLVILGDWAARDILVLLGSSSPAVRDAVVFVDHTTEPELYFAAADILVHPALDEPFGRVIAEAQVCGIPPVGTNSGGAREIIRHGSTGLLADPHDSADFVQRVLELARDVSLRRRLGEQALAEARSRFDMASFRAAVGAFYQRKVFSGTAGSGPASESR